MTEEEILNMDDQEVFTELQEQFGQDALEEVGSYTQQFEIQLEQRGQLTDYIAFLKSMTDTPENFENWSEKDAWQLMKADLRTRARAALLSTDTLM
ncbi:MAG: hypothetical protein GF372_14535 [Candidatus Marinimicrobia bacterium]|jgi:hypothetical protein|nr:hypothetical protein [Candidatus Neomarinimicrobiota bacterium]